jgi:hypothetical protein
MGLRISASLVLLISVLFLPIWVSVIIGLGAMLYFNMFGEAVAIFLLGDLLFGTPQVKFWGFTYVLSTAVVLALMIIELLKKKLKFYSKV